MSCTNMKYEYGMIGGNLRVFLLLGFSLSLSLSLSPMGTPTMAASMELVESTVYATNQYVGLYVFCLFQHISKHADMKDIKCICVRARKCKLIYFFHLKYSVFTYTHFRTAKIILALLIEHQEERKKKRKKRKRRFCLL